MSIRRQTISVIAILIGIYFIISLSRELLELLSARERIAKEEAEVSRLEEEQRELASQLEYVASEEFVESEAREKLLMRKPGEVVVFLPEEETGQIEKVKQVEKADRKLANWEKWAQLFGFYR